MVLDELTLEAELAPGTPLGDVLAISSEVLELEITPNRPDCLGVYGVARELHAATGAPLAPAPWLQDTAVAGLPGAVKVTVEAPELCPRFTARVFENVTIAPSPLWLKARLVAAGQRPINNVVDITNYAMLRPASRCTPSTSTGSQAKSCSCVARPTASRCRRWMARRDPGRRDAGDRGRRGTDLDRRSDGRRPLGGRGTDDARSARGRELERARTSTGPR